MTVAPDILAELIEPGKAETVRRLHGHRFGTTYSYVIPLASATIILVLPVHMVPDRPPMNVVWAEVSWKYREQQWQCVLHNLPQTDPQPESRTLHLTLKQALWRARRHVIRNAAPEAELVEDLPVFAPLQSVYAPESDIYAYRSMVAQMQLHIPIRMNLAAGEAS